VLVKNAELDTGSSARLAQMLRSTRVLPKHIVEVVFDWRDPLALVQQLQNLEPDSPPIVDRAPTPSPRPVLRKRSQSRVAGSREPTGPRRTVTELPSRREKARSSRPATKIARTNVVRKAEPRPPSHEPALEATTGQVPAEVVVPAHVDPPHVDPDHVSSDDAPTASYAPVSAALPGSIGATPDEVLLDAPRGSSDLDDCPAPRPPPATGGIRTSMTGSFAATTRRGLRLAARAIAGPRARMLAFAGGGIGALVLAGVLFATIGDDDDALVSEGATNVAISVPPAEPEERDEEPSQTGPTRQDAIAQARVQGELGIHEGIVYAPLDSPKQDFEGAAAMCDEMNRGAIGGWRMPKLGELHTLAAAHVVERGVYWSGTEADGFPGSALLWSEKNTRAAPIGKRWKGARSLCVLDDPETN
jgi:hypothetical protein